MLAVGYYTRGQDGGNFSQSAVAANVPSAGEGPQSQSNANVYAASNATAIAGDESGFAFMHDDGVAYTPTNINQSNGVAQTSAAQFLQYRVNDAARASTRVTLSSVGNGSFGYTPDPNFSQNLVQHVHLFIAIVGGDVVTEGAQVTESDISTLATDGGNFIGATLTGDNIFTVTSNLPEVPTYSSVGGANLHVELINIPSSLNLLAATSLNMGAVSYAVGAFAQGSWSLAAGTWAYVDGNPSGIGAGAGLFSTPGDFNYDGQVNEADYDIWASDAPQADATVVDEVNGVRFYDGIVDSQDYAIWAANANAILVTTNLDVVNANDGVLSLREAVALAADANHPGSDIIAFDSGLLGSTITLVSPILVNYANPVRILGPGSDQLTVRANGAFSAFNVMGNTGATPTESLISHLAITGASTNSIGVQFNDSTNLHDLVLDSLVITASGTGVTDSSGQLVIRNSTISNNYWDGITRASHSAPPSSASLTITNSQIVNNARFGISIRNMDVYVSDSEIDGNGVNARGVVGNGIGFSDDGDNPGIVLTVLGSTIAENNGYGIALGSQTVANITNTTVSSNTNTGILVNGATATLTNDTITKNSVAASGGTAGVYAGSGAIVIMHNTIVAENYSGPSGSQVRADLGRYSGTPAGSFSVGTSSYNLIGDAGNSGISTAFNNIILPSNQSAGLLALDYYGGKTRTHALLSTSLAIDAGDEAKAIAVGLLYDQRGPGFNRVIDGDGVPDEGLDIDIGAFESASNN